MPISFPDHYSEFLHQLGKKLVRGQETYGSASFDKPEDEILAELQAEAIDLAGWGYVLWAKIEAARQRAKQPHECHCRCGKAWVYKWDESYPTGKTMVESQDETHSG